MRHHRAHVRRAAALAATLETLVAEITRLSSRIEHDIAQLPDGRIVMSFPRSGRICAAAILAELGDVRERFPTADQLAAEAGVAPVTNASGNSRHASAWAASIYNQARQRCRLMQG